MKFRSNIRKAFETRLVNWAKTKSIPVAVENIKLIPPSTAYLSCFLLAGQTTNTSVLYDTGKAVGVFQVDVHYPINTGSSGIELLAKEISDLFPDGLILPIDLTSNVRVTTPVDAREAVAGSSHLTLSLSIYYSTI